jgi:hypothetical protein
MSGIKQASAELEAKRSGGGGSGPQSIWFKLKAGQETIVRFLEQDDEVHWAMMHEVPVEGRQWGRSVPCVDQERDGTPCPGCEADLPRKFQGYINVIWDDAPVFKRDDQGKVVRDSTGDIVVLDNKPQPAIWSSGIRLFEELEELNTNYRGLKTRRFKVKRKGSGFDTKYVFSPENIDSGPQDFSSQEEQLASQKGDLSQHVNPFTYEEFEKVMNGGSSQSSNGGNQQSQQRANPFMRRS